MKNEKEILKKLQETEKKAEKWLSEWNKKQKADIEISSAISLEKPKKDNFDRLIGCGG